jgi:hypothetical protein
MSFRSLPNPAFCGLAIAAALSLMQMVELGRGFAQESARTHDFNKACELSYDAKQCAGALNFIIARRGREQVNSLLETTDPDEFSRKLREVIELGEPYQPDSSGPTRSTRN